MRHDASELPPQLRRAKELSDAFFDWEVQGRSWTNWPYPVALEPPFSLPTALYENQARRADAGRVPGVLEAPFRLLGRALSAAMSRRRAKPPEAERPPAQVDSRELVTLSLLPSHRESTDPVSWERLLLALPSLHTPLHLEILGEAAQVSLSLQVPAEFVGEVKAQVAAHAPSLAVAETQNDSLSDRWQALDEQGSLVLDFGLAQEFMRPLATFKSWKADPLTALYAALSSLEPEELAVLQLQFQLCRGPWAEVAADVLVTADGKPFLADAAESVPLAREKFSSPLFAVVLRLGCKASSQDRASQIAQSVAQALLVMARSSSNHLLAMEPGPLDDELLEQDLLLRQSRRTGMLLSCAELATLAHPPSAHIQLPKLARGLRSSRAAPAACSGPGLLLGINEHAGESSEVRLWEASSLSPAVLLGVSPHALDEVCERLRSLLR